MGVQINDEDDKMTRITISEGRFEVEAETVARGLNISEEDLRSGLQSGRITSQSETGQDEDAGRFRLTFYSPTRRVRLVVNESGEVLTTSSADFVRRNRSS